MNTSSDFRIPVQHVSDTAYMVAGYRAAESKRSDALFHDELAAKLVGKFQGDVLDRMPDSNFGEWMMAIRTWLIDQHILALTTIGGVDTVINLAAGLDSRPYRLKVPASTQWVEVDLPGIIDYKTLILKDEQPVCELKRITCDLSQDNERQEALRKALQLARSAVVLTEGLLMYLKPENVVNLANELRAEAKVQWWLMDVITQQFFEWAVKRWREQPGATDGASGIAFTFVPEAGLRYFEQLGWEVKDFTSFGAASASLKRSVPSQVPPEAVAKDSGIGLLHNPG